MHHCFNVHEDFYSMDKRGIVRAYVILYVVCSTYALEYKIKDIHIYIQYVHSILYIVL